MTSMPRPRRLSRKLAAFLCVVGTGICVIIFLDPQKILLVLKKEYQRRTLGKLDVHSWLYNNQSLCDGSFLGYGHQFAVLRNVVIKPTVEAFYLTCQDSRKIDYKFTVGKEGTHLNSWVKSIEVQADHLLKAKYSIVKSFSVAVKRYEYANMYHTITDWYNVFLVAKLLNKSLDDINILLFDINTGHMDDTWKTLYGNVIKVPSLRENICVETLVWNILGYESPVNYHGLEHLPLVKEFRDFFLIRHNVLSTKHLVCPNISIFFLWRRDYIPYPGSENDDIKRKIANEIELIQTVREHFPTAHVDGDRFDQMSFKEQLKIVTSTDILISAHGAGLSHILFLPDHAGVVELFPMYWIKFPGMVHFEAMARWRGLHYHSWQNLNPSNEFEHWKTYIPPVVVLSKIRSIYNEMCNDM